MINPASESAHHQPNALYTTSPTNTTPDRQVQSRVCMESAMGASRTHFTASAALRGRQEDEFEQPR